MIHPLSDVQSVNIGENTDIWQYSVILKNAVIGSNCNINCHVFIENDVVIGNNVTVKSGVYLWNGIQIEDNVFIGPNVTFTNDKTPRSKQYPDDFQKTIIRQNASIGAGCIVLGGIVVGEYSMAGAGALLTKSVPPRALVTGSPASIVGWLNNDGTKMISENDYYLDNSGNKWNVKDNSLVKL
jgi:acetyltransferase-like isoleucine patch superfamily enzyme